MESRSIKETIDLELGMIRMNENMQRNIKNSFRKSDTHKIFRVAAAVFAVLILGTTTVAAGYFLTNSIHVNDEMLMELDEMYVVRINSIEGKKDQSGQIERDFYDYDQVQEELGIRLLDSPLAEEGFYLQGHISTDNKDYAMIKMENYITGDTSDFQYLPEEGWYEYKHGETYDSPVSLNISLILSEEQLKVGWNSDYLGMYESVESYLSEQGFRVNLIQSTSGGENTVSEKIAVFVSGGIQYELRGHVSFETMKEIVRTMQ